MTTFRQITRGYGFPLVISKVSKRGNLSEYVLEAPSGNEKIKAHMRGTARKIFFNADLPRDDVNVVLD